MICPCLRQNYLFMHDLKRRYLSRFQNEINSRALDIQGLGSAHCNLTILMRRISNSETLQARLGGAGPDAVGTEKSKEITSRLRPPGQQRQVSGTIAAFRSWLLATNSNIIICRTQNPDIPRASRVGVAHGGAGQSRAGWGADGSVRLGFDTRTLQGIVRSCSVNGSSEARTSEIPCKPMGEQKSF